MKDKNFIDSLDIFTRDCIGGRNPPCGDILTGDTKKGIQKFY